MIYRIIFSFTLIASLFSLANRVIASEDDLSEEKADHGKLIVDIEGFKKELGNVVVKLYREQDDAPKGDGYLSIVEPLSKRSAQVAFEGLAFGEYAIFVFHDKNGNKDLDHNMFKIPSEPMGFSGGFKLSLFSGVPRYEELKFSFSVDSQHVNIKVK